MASPVRTNSGTSGDGIYRPLSAGQIRLFKIDKSSDGSNKDIMGISFRACAISEVENYYVAVSYTWLDKTFGITAQENRTHVSVTCHGTYHARATRLWPLLSRLSKEDEVSTLAQLTTMFDRAGKCTRELEHRTQARPGPMPLVAEPSYWYWLDAICINQDDDSERGRQVGLMGAIYAAAAMVYVYLGQEPKPSGGEQDQLSELVCSNVAIYHTYWSRKWFIQELVRAKAFNLLLGAKHELRAYVFCAWLDFKLEFARPLANADFDIQLARGIRSLVDLRVSFRDGQPAHILRLLERTRSSQATDVRDALYSRLGITHNGALLVPTPSYEDDVATLFARFVRSYFTLTGSLYVICLARWTHGASSLPSWAPDWSRVTGRQPLAKGFVFKTFSHSELERIEAMKGRATKILGIGAAFSQGLYSLNVSGWKIDTIGPFLQGEDAHTPDSAPMLQLLFETYYPFVQLRRTVREEHSKLLAQTYVAFANLLISGTPFSYTAVLPLGDLFVETLNSWATEIRDVSIRGKTAQMWAEQYLTCTGASSRRDPYLPLEDNDAHGPESSLHNMRKGRRLTGSRRGLPVLVPEETVDGDIICILWHCPVPVVLRQVQDHYILIGECCMRGYMINDRGGLSSMKHLIQLCWVRLAEERKPATIFEIH